MQASELHGVIAAIVTPFDARDRLDEAALRRLTRYVIDGGADGIMTAGGRCEREFRQCLAARETMPGLSSARLPALAEGKVLI